MRTVRLPIVDNGMPTSEYLEVSVEILQRLAQTSIVYKDHVKVVTPPLDEGTKKIIEAFRVQQESDRKAAEELDKLNRIVHDLPEVPVTYKKQKVELPLSEQWERISLHPNYEINPLLEVRNFWTKRIMEVTTTPTRVKMVELHDKMGHPQLFSLHNLSAMVYGS